MSITDYKSNLPKGVSGDWSIQKFRVTKDDAGLYNLQCAIGGELTRRIDPGRYTKLVHKGYTIMSDTPAELRDHRVPVMKATGRCLVHGLGMGMVADLMLQKKEVTHVTVVELDPDVIQLTARWLRKKHITNDRLTIIQGNALTYKHIAGTKWNVVWHDIWPDISEENLTDMHKLHRSFGGRCDWQGSWARELCERY